MPDFIQSLFQEYGLLVPYAVIVSFIGLSASNFAQLLASLAIISGVYIAISKIFAMTIDFGLLDLTGHFILPEDQKNMIMVIIFVFVVGFISYIFKSAIRD